MSIPPDFGSPWVKAKSGEGSWPIVLVVIPNFITDIISFGLRSIGSSFARRYAGALREIIRQTCSEMGVRIEKGVLSNDHVHMFVSIPPHLALSTVMQRIKGRSSRKIQMEFPDPAQTILGQAVLGPWIFLDHIRQCD